MKKHHWLFNKSGLAFHDNVILELIKYQRIINQFELKFVKTRSLG